MKDKSILIRVAEKDKKELELRAQAKGISLAKLIRLQMLSDYTNL